MFTNKTFNETSCKEPTCDLGLPTCKDRKDKAACGNTDTMDPDLEPMVPHLTQKQAAILPVPGQAGFLPCATKEMKNKEVFKSRAKENDQYIKDLLKAVNEGAKAHEIHDSWVYSSTKGQKRKSADRKSKVRLNRRLLLMEDALGTRDLDLGKSQQQLGEGFFKKSLPRRRRSKKGCDMMTAKCVESSLRRRSRFPTYHAARAKANIKCNFCLSSADKDNVKKAADPKALASTILNKMIQKVIVPPIKAQILKRAPQLWLPVVKKLLDTITKHSLLDDKSRTAMFAEIKSIVMEDLPPALKLAVLPVLGLKILDLAPWFSPVWRNITSIVRDHKVMDGEERSKMIKELIKTATGPETMTAIKMAWPAFVVHNILPKAGMDDFCCNPTGDLPMGIGLVRQNSGGGGMQASANIRTSFMGKNWKSQSELDYYPWYASHTRNYCKTIVV